MLPWAKMMRAAVSAGVRVKDFWELSLCEWRWLAALSEADAPSREILSQLMKLYPDRDDENG